MVEERKKFEFQQTSPAFERQGGCFDVLRLRLSEMALVVAKEAREQPGDLLLTVRVEPWDFSLRQKSQLATAKAGIEKRIAELEEETAHAKSLHARQTILLNEWLIAENRAFLALLDGDGAVDKDREK